MTRNDRLNHLLKKWQALGIESDFPAVHHFSSDRFETESSSLNTFVTYCADKELGGENAQTLERATAAVYLHEGGMWIEAAIAKAWDDFPLVTR